MSTPNRPITAYSRVQQFMVPVDEVGRRIDNFLISCLSCVPKSHIYKILRKGEVRVNRKRVAPYYQLRHEDVVRLPPIVLTPIAAPTTIRSSTAALLEDSILYEDAYVIVINKPQGMSVHAGSTVRYGVIEAFKQMYTQYPHLELAHRLDAETSGCLILAKKKSILRELHCLLREGNILKQYWALTQGTWPLHTQRVNLALRKVYDCNRQHRVRVMVDGKASVTLFQPLTLFQDNITLVTAIPETGRTHQIRVHAAHCGHPIAGDDRYGNKQFNHFFQQIGLRQLFLHARSVKFTLASVRQCVQVIAPLPELLAQVLTRLTPHHDQCRGE